MAVPQKRNHRGGLVSRERVSNAGIVAGPIRRPGRRRARGEDDCGRVRHMSVGALLYRRRRRDADFGDDARCSDDAPANRGNANRTGAAHQSDFVMFRTPPRHPPRGPPKIRQCSSRRRATGRFDAPRGGARSPSRASARFLRFQNAHNSSGRLSTSGARAYGDEPQVCTKQTGLSKRAPFRARNRSTAT
jgi:hypothetical protein